MSALRKFARAALVGAVCTALGFGGAAIVTWGFPPEGGRFAAVVFGILGFLGDVTSQSFEDIWMISPQLRRLGAAPRLRDIHSFTANEREVIRARHFGWERADFATLARVFDTHPNTIKAIVREIGA